VARPKRQKPKRKRFTTAGMATRRHLPVPGDQDIAYYVAFVQHFVLGKMNVADSIYQQKGQAIDGVAAYLRRAAPPKKGPLYRGWMIEPEKVVAGKIAVDHPIPISFSRDRGVACFFADPRTTISAFISQLRPRARGYVMRLTGWNASQVLWTYEWNDQVPAPGWGGMPLGSITALALPGKLSLSEHDTRVVDRNVREQKEVILKPLPKSAKTQLEPLAKADCPPTGVLNARYAG
jgi:hypothetical protein